MKKTVLISGFSLLLLLNGFDIPDPTQSTQYTPVFMLRNELEKSVKIDAARTLRNPGKIYIKDHFIFISEKYSGIHVIDNSNPENPVNKAFVQIDGCIDMAVKNDILYADNAVDLLAIKVKPDVGSIEVTSRIRNVFPETASPDGYGLSYKQGLARPKDAVLVRWEKRY